MHGLQTSIICPDCAGRSVGIGGRYRVCNRCDGSGRIVVEVNPYPSLRQLFVGLVGAVVVLLCLGWVYSVLMGLKAWGVQ